MIKKRTYLRKFIVILVVGMAFLQISPKAFAVNADSLLEQADAQYAKGLYEQAAQTYTMVNALGLESANLYYNTGNAWFKSGNITKALLYFHKARKLDPSDEDILFNIKIAETQIADKIEAVPEFFLSSWWKKTSMQLSLGQWAVMSIITFILFLSLAGFYLFSSRLSTRKLSFWLALICLFLTLSSFLAGNKQKHLNSKKEAIVFSPVVNVKSSPAVNSTGLFVIHEGTFVEIRDQIDNWYEIRLLNGEIGWLQIEDVEVI